jgi:hypothetical protein
MLSPEAREAVPSERQHVRLRYDENPPEKKWFE